MTRSEVAKSIHDLIQQILIDDVNALVRALREGTISQSSGLVEIEYLISGPRDSANLFLRVLEVWKSNHGGDLRVLAVAIEACAIAADRSSTPPRAELVWTGPKSGHPTARRTLQVMNEMLRRPMEEVLIVGYSIFLKGELAQKFVDRLATLSSRGVSVMFIVDRRYRGWGPTGAEGHSIREIREAWPTNVRRPSIYSWTSEDNETSKLHAKLLLTDNRDLLVTSANLSGGGLETNLELGIRVQGEVARDCGEHFKQLIRSNFFQREEWPS